MPNEAPSAHRLLVALTPGPVSGGARSGTRVVVGSAGREHPGCPPGAEGWRESGARAAGVGSWFVFGFVPGQVVAVAVRSVHDRSQFSGSTGCGRAGRDVDGLEGGDDELVAGGEDGHDPDRGDDVLPPLVAQVAHEPTVVAQDDQQDPDERGDDDGERLGGDDELDRGGSLGQPVTVAPTVSTPRTPRRTRQEESRLPQPRPSESSVPPAVALAIMAESAAPKNQREDGSAGLASQGSRTAENCCRVAPSGPPFP